MDEYKYDRRLIAKGFIPDDYSNYLKSLRCCLCGSIKPCKCTIEDLKASSNKSLNTAMRMPPASQAG
jgi:hypothetical protein